MAAGPLLSSFLSRLRVPPITSQRKDNMMSEQDEARPPIGPNCGSRDENGTPGTDTCEEAGQAADRDRIRADILEYVDLQTRCMECEEMSDEMNERLECLARNIYLGQPKTHIDWVLDIIAELIAESTDLLDIMDMQTKALADNHGSVFPGRLP